MKRFLTAPFVGGVIGALEGAATFSALLMMESRAGFVFGTAKDWLFPVLMMGLVCGVIFGAIIGFLVALLDATWSIGGSIGSIVGLVLGLALFVMTADETIRLLAILVILAGGSIGLLSAALTRSTQSGPA